MDTTATARARQLGIPNILIEAAVMDDLLDELVEHHIAGLVEEWRGYNVQDGAFCTDCMTTIGASGICRTCQKSYENSLRILIEHGQASWHTH